MSIKTAEELCQEYSNEMDVDYYHGQRSTAEKAKVFERWIGGETPLLFCTSGFGVGIDYGSVTLVIHYDGVWNLLDFVQESGRAGRNEAAARSLVLVKPNWEPVHDRNTASEVQAVAEFLNPEAYCRRFVLGKYMDGSGFSCLTYPKAALCDKCRSTLELVPDQRQGDDNKHQSLQHPEGPMPAIKRTKVDATGPMREKIVELFATINRYRGCPLCACNRRQQSHHDYDEETLSRDHNLSVTALPELSRQTKGACYGCGLSLVLVNGISPHVPSTTCIFASRVRTICNYLFTSESLSQCLTNMDPGFDSRNVKSYARWLRDRPLGESVNNLTKLLCNWAELIHCDDDLLTDDGRNR
ncbi:hypothetical protein V1509DRAFT_573037 [Lipomyces kononenkoae]